MIRFLAALWLCLLLVDTAAAVDLFVNNSVGDDRYSGLEPELRGGGAGPVRSIRRAMQLADKGDRIILANTGEPYRESISLSGGRNWGTAAGPFAIVGGGAVLDGSLPIPATAWEHYRDNIYRYRPERLGHQRLFLEGQPIPRHPAPRTSEQVPDLEPLTWFDRGAYVYFCTEENRMPDAYPISHAVLQTGVTLFHVQNVVVVDLVIQGFRIDGVSAFDGASQCLLGGLTCRGNGRAGIFVGGASRVLIDSCLVGANGQAEVILDGHSQTILRNTDLVEEGAPPLEKHGGQLEIQNPPEPDQPQQ